MRAVRLQTGFNPRICKRCDRLRIFRKTGLFYVSIHASVKDATHLICQVPNRYLSFNPRICKRCDSMFVKSFIDDTFKL